MSQYRFTKWRPQIFEELQDYIAEEWVNTLWEEVEKCMSDLQATLRAVIAAEGRYVTRAEKKWYKIKM